MKQIYIGVESFEEVIENDYFYIDKTILIKELLENKGKVTLITRPRRFGKSLNMNMLEEFFDIGKDSRALFEGLKIMEHSDIVDGHMNKHPVFSLTLRGVEEDTYKDFIDTITYLVSEVYWQHSYLYKSDKLNEQQKEVFDTLHSGKSNISILKTALQFLTKCLHAHYGKKVIVLLDEYDTPLDTALKYGYYEQALGFMRGFMGKVFKSNNHLEFGVLTGVQRVTKESLVSSFNNPQVYGIMNIALSTCFGLTQEEVKESCRVYGLADKFDEVERWYNGYRFGGMDIYNPWSIIGFLKEKEFNNYWANTGSTDILADIFFKGTDELKDDMAGLLTGGTIKMQYDDQIRYPIEYANSDMFWSLLLNAGYIKPCAGAKGEPFNAELVNKEVKNIFTRCVDRWYKKQAGTIKKTVKTFVESLLSGDKDGVSETLNEELLNNPSCHDLKEENSYHMFIFGILLAVSGDYTVLSNPESGKGRSDCLIKPNDKNKHAVIIEFKHQSKTGEDLENDAKEGLKQIEEKSYTHNLKNEGYNHVHKYGIAFHKKSCAVVMG